MLQVVPVQYGSDTWVLVVRGSVDYSNVTKLQEALDGLFAKGVFRIIFDMEQVSFIASAGFACLLRARDVVTEHGGGIVFAGTHSRVREIFDLLGITSILRFAPDLGGALVQLEA